MIYAKLSMRFIVFLSLNLFQVFLKCVVTILNIKLYIEYFPNIFY